MGCTESTMPGDLEGETDNNSTPHTHTSHPTITAERYDTASLHSGHSPPSNAKQSHQIFGSSSRTPAAAIGDSHSARHGHTCEEADAPEPSSLTHTSEVEDTHTCSHSAGPETDSPTSIASATPPRPSPRPQRNTGARLHPFISFMATVSHHRGLRRVIVVCGDDDTRQSITLTVSTHSLVQDMMGMVRHRWDLPETTVVCLWACCGCDDDDRVVLLDSRLTLGAVFKDYREGFVGGGPVLVATTGGGDEATVPPKKLRALAAHRHTTTKCNESRDSETHQMSPQHHPNGVPDAGVRLKDVQKLSSGGEAVPVPNLRAQRISVKSSFIGSAEWETAVAPDTTVAALRRIVSTKEFVPVASIALFADGERGEGRKALHDDSTVAECELELRGVSWSLVAPQQKERRSRTRKSRGKKARSSATAPREDGPPPTGPSASPTRTPGPTKGKKSEVIVPAIEESML